MKEFPLECEEDLTRDKLELLHSLLNELIMEPEWDTTASAWKSLVEAKRQVAIELQEAP